MKKNADEIKNEPFFDLPVENELLMMKLQAEFGAECTTGIEDIPPSVVNEFLKSVYEFEQKFRERGCQVTVYQKMGSPPFIAYDQLSAGAVKGELRRLIANMNAHGIELDVIGHYEDAVIYKFLTEELFHEETDDIDLPGYKYHFCYEEFHPNHEIDTRNLVVDFIKKWFSRSIDICCWELANPCFLPDSRPIKREEVVKKIEYFMDAYPLFRNERYNIGSINFMWDNANEKGSGSASGTLSYEACSESGEWVKFEGDYQLYLSNDDNWWNIYHFSLPGFSLNE